MPRQAIKWERVEVGIWRRQGKSGKPTYRALRQAGTNPDTGKPRQEVRMFPGAKVDHALNAARLWRAQGSIAKEAGALPVSTVSRMTLEEVYVKLHEDVDYAPATRYLHGSLWKALPESLKRQRLRDVTPLAVTTALEGIHAPVFREKARILVSTVYRYAIRRLQGDVANPAGKGWSDPSRNAKAHKTDRRYLTDDELAGIIREVPERYRALVRLLAYVGLRPGEAYALTVGKLDPIAGTLTIDRAVNDYVVAETKTGNERRVPLPAVIVDELTAHVERYSNPENPDALMFPSDEGDMLNASNFRKRIFRPAVRRAGLKDDVRVYDLRHRACSWALSNGVDPATLSRMTGHTVAVLLSTYSHYAEDAGRKAAERLDGIIRSSA